jgi:hypothetical protein
MSSNNISVERVAVKYGLIIFISLVAYFLFMKLVGLFEIHELRALNFFIMFAGIWKALTYYKKETGLSFFGGIGLGSLTAIIGVLPFAIFIFFYLQADTQFMHNIVATEAFGQYLNPYILAFLIAFEGGISGVLVSFGMMQFLKKSRLVSAS